MESVYINGGISLQGQVRIQGSKNAVLPILAATLLTDDSCVIENCPRLTDVEHMQTLLQSLGCAVTRDKTKLKVNTDGVNCFSMPCALSGEAVRGMRSSIILLGAMLSRMGETVLEYPGGCVIGKRPIDLHLEALKEMNVHFEEKSYGIYAVTDGLVGAEITLPKPSVGATENLILAAVRAKGTTVICGAAKEPEIVTLCEFLKLCGAEISGAGSDRIVIFGKETLDGTEFFVPGDRIVAGTYLCACMAAKGEVLLRNAPVMEMQSALEVAREMGAVCQETKEGLYVQVHEPLQAVSKISTAPYPGFPTDMQSLFLAVLTLTKGRCMIEENIFENRFHIVPYLQKMGANIKQIDEKHVLVEGVESLHGYTVNAQELRGGAALVIAGLAARGETVVDNCHYIARGYENICRDLRELGVRIYGV